jgi:uncharacterized protein YjbI with pentapeptide repeats
VNRLGKPPHTPYAPDLDDDAVAVGELADMVDAVAEDADWSNLRARGLVARRAAWRRCRLTGTELAEAALSDLTLAECRLDLAGLRMAKLERVVFRDCRMTECDLYEADLKDVLLERCDLREATLTGLHLTRVELRGCRLDGVRGLASLAGARIPWADVVENGHLFAAALGVEIIE